MANTKTDSEPFGLCKNDADFLKYFHISLKDIRSLIISSIGYYQRGKSSIRSCYYTAFCVLLERTQVLEPLVIEIVPHLHLCVIHLLQLCRHINVNKTSMLFRSSFYLKELEAYVETLGQLIACLGYLQKLMSVSVPGELFMDEGVGDDLLLQVEMLNTDCFYSRCLGLQFCESIKKALQAVMVVMATFSECYDEPSQVIQVASSLLNSGKYILDEDVVDITRTADIKFCKAFWSIPESPILHQLRSFTFPHVEVSDVFTLPAENFELPLTDESGETAVITPPCAHTGPAPVSVRLISHAMREGMDVMRSRFRPKTGSSKKEVLPKSRSLLFHCHGGGFVAQSSQSHEDYLRLWSRQLEAPILSVDYSLAPEQPFPRALEETFYAYAWALNNHDKLGWTGERVCFAGDSAGGNLVVSTALRAVSYGIRVPDGILAAYPALLVQYTPSPARLMSMIDPLLPVGILTRCLAAYAGIADKFSSALAAPVFCNPGKVETWEVVKSSEAPLDNVINELANHNADDKFAESGQTEDTKKARDDCGHSAIGKEKVKGSCDSGDELSENDFIVYDCDGKEEERICYLQSPISKNRSAENEKIEGNLKGGKNERHKKQASVSDTSDSGINGDTDVDSGMEVQDAYIKLSRETVNDVGAEDGAKGVRSKMVAPQSGVMETRAKVSVQKSFENISQESKTSKSETVKHVDERKTKSNTPFAKKRHMSLDLPVTFHPGQKSGPPDNVLNSETPFSPQLYPGALSFTPKLFSVQRKIAQSPLQLFRQLPIVKNYYMSPLLAPDDLLLGLPEVHLAACHFDPLLDDSVTFAKKLKSLGKPVNLKVYDSLPHGFFNFSSSSTEAKQATDACLECMKRVLNVETEKSSDSH
ncbi:LIPS-like protein [Mya arenaria]|uniref:LIPS-like protein n=1 Tax=Mya arenaria TaxID=6604 RepID=A0ABY7E605_MYAAR|nr:LIPS-like protein [Mya arenaria]